MRDQRGEFKEQRRGVEPEDDLVGVAVEQGCGAIMRCIDDGAGGDFKPLIGIDSYYLLLHYTITKDI